MVKNEIITSLYYGVCRTVVEGSFFKLNTNILCFIKLILGNREYINTPFLRELGVKS